MWLTTLLRLEFSFFKTESCMIYSRYLGALNEPLLHFDTGITTEAYLGLTYRCESTHSSKIAFARKPSTLTSQ